MDSPLGFTEHSQRASYCAMFHRNEEEYTVPTLKELTGSVSCAPLQFLKLLHTFLEGSVP